MYPDVAKKDDVKTLKCNVCHFGKSKKNRNDYGKAIAKALAPKKNLKKSDANKEIFDEALKTAAKQKAQPRTRPSATCSTPANSPLRLNSERLPGTLPRDRRAIADDPNKTAGKPAVLFFAAARFRPTA